VESDYWSQWSTEVCEDDLEEPSHGAGRAEPLELGPGAVLAAAGSGFRVEAVLGRGSFGAVWLARDTLDGREVAIKDILCHSASDAINAEHEVALLQDFGGPGSCIPALLAAVSERLSGGGRRVCLVMDRLHGEPLLDALTDGSLVASRQHRGVANACSFVRQLLVQVLPAFVQISQRVQHRDAHARNVMVEVPGAGLPIFGLIDFGLAVDTGGWARGGWRNRGVAGDCRYWPVSSWLVFERGPRGISRSESLCREYETRLDQHSLGLTALQALAELSDSRERAEDSVSLAAARLRTAWQSYWVFAMRCWREVLEAYQGCGHAEHVKAQYAEDGVHVAMGRHFDVLHLRIAELRDACPLASGAPAVLGALLTLIGGADGTEGASTWEDVLESVAGEA